LKAIIVDMDGDYLIVANSRGDFKRIYNSYPGCQVGDEITVRENKTGIFGQMLSPFAARRVMAIAACFLFMIFAGYSIQSFLNPITYVTIDINPSVEFSLNKFDLVRDARPLNEDGKIILGDGREFINMKIDKALNLLLSRAVEAEFLNEEANTVMLTVSSVKDDISSGKKEELREIAQNQLQSLIEKEEGSSLAGEEAPEIFSAGSFAAHTPSKVDVKIIVEDTTFEKHREAEKMAISQGKLVLYEKLKQKKPDVALEQIKEASVGQIIKELEKLELKEKPAAKEEKKANIKNKKHADEKAKEIKEGKKKPDEDKQQVKNKKEEIKGVQKAQKEQIKNAREPKKDTLKEKGKEPGKNADKITKGEKDKANLQNHKSGDNKQNNKKDKVQHNSNNKINKNGSKK